MLLFKIVFHFKEQFLGETCCFSTNHGNKYPEHLHLNYPCTSYSIIIVVEFIGKWDLPFQQYCLRLS